MAATLTLHRRAQTDLSTWGDLLDPTGTELCKILERGPSNPDHVRIPAGLYQIGRKPFGTSHFDEAFKALIGASYKGILWLPNVPGRTNIELHTANFVSELLGCLATGGQITVDENHDFAIAGGTSKPAYAKMYGVVSSLIDGDGADLLIRDLSQTNA